MQLKTIGQVVDGGYCVGCGACAYAGGFKMQLNQYGEYVPQGASDRAHNADDPLQIVCPSLQPQLNEDVLAAPLFAEHCEHDSKIGYYCELFGGYVAEGAYRENGTSGGFGTWIGSELLRLGLIDGVIHVKPQQTQDADEPLFRYAISRDEAEIVGGAKTRYHVVEFSGVLEEVRQTEGRYLFVGVPCMCKAIRRIQRMDQVIADRIVFVASLVCGHLKSTNWTKSLAWSQGIEPKDLAAFQYRTKSPEIPARAYVFRATPRQSSLPVIQQDSAAVPGGKYNSGALMLNACDYCDDVVGETSDITIGDAWLPRFEADNRGTNLLVVRNPKLRDLLCSAADSGRVQLSRISAKEAANSQSGGFRHRREGLSYRLAVAEAQGIPYPIKRVKPNEFRISRLRKRVYDARREVVVQSRIYFQAAIANSDFSIYAKAMNPLVSHLRRLEYRSIFFRALTNRLTRLLRRGLFTLQHKSDRNSDRT